MIVLAIVGVIAAYAIPAYQDYLARSRVGEGLSLASSARLAVAENAASGNAFSGGYASPPATRNVESIRVDDDTGQITDRLHDARRAGRFEHADAGAIGARQCGRTDRARRVEQGLGAGGRAHVGMFRWRQNGVFVAGAGRGARTCRCAHPGVESRPAGVPFVNECDMSAR